MKATKNNERRPKRRGNHSRARRDGYLKSLNVERFRGFKSLNVNRLAPITIVTGDNGSGKSTLLEAAFALHERTSPAWVLNVQGRRGLPTVTSHGLCFLGLFYGGSEDGVACVSGITARGTEIALQIERADTERQAVMFETNLDDSEKGARTAAEADIRGLSQRAAPLRFRAIRAGKEENQSELLWVFRPPDTGEFRLPGAKEAFPVALFQHPSDGALGTDDRRRYGDIREAGRDRAVLDVVRMVDPRIEDIEYLQTSRTQYFRAKLKDGRTLPLGMLGGGVVNIFRSGVNLASAENGFLAIDEIENGIHFSRHAEVFSSLLMARRRFGAQLMLATHSGEALAAIVRAAGEIDPDSYTVVHLRRTPDDTVLANVIAGRDARSSIEHGYDLR